MCLPVSTGKDRKVERQRLKKMDGGRIVKHNRYEDGEGERWSMELSMQGRGGRGWVGGRGIQN